MDALKAAISVATVEDVLGRISIVGYYRERPEMLLKLLKDWQDRMSNW